MKEIINHYHYPKVEGNKLIVEQDNGGISIEFFSTETDAKKALIFAIFCQRAGLALRVDRKIMIKKSKKKVNHK